MIHYVKPKLLENGYAEPKSCIKTNNIKNFKFFFLKIIIIAEIKSIFRENQPKNIVMLDEIVILSMFEITLTKLMLSIKLSCYKIKTAILSARCSDLYDFC